MRQSTILKTAMTGFLAVTVTAAAWSLLPQRSHQAAAASGGYLVNVAYIDIVPDKFDAFMALARDNALAALKDTGVHEYDVMISNDDPHRVLFIEVYDNAAALEAHRATDHVKKFFADTKDLVIKRDVKQYTSVAMNMAKAM